MIATESESKAQARPLLSYRGTYAETHADKAECIDREKRTEGNESANHPAIAAQCRL